MSFTTLSIKDGSGGNQNLKVAQDGSNNLSSTSVAVDSSGAELVGQKTMAASLPVVVASNQSAIPVSDNSGSITVDAPQGTPVFVRLSDGTNPITTLPVSLASVPSHAVTNAGTFAVQNSYNIVDNAAFTDGTSRVSLAGYVFDEVAGTALTENDAAAARVDNKRAQVLVIEDATTRGRRMTVTSTGEANTNVTLVGGNAINLGAGSTGSGTQRVIIANDQTAIPISDGGGSITVDGTVSISGGAGGAPVVVNCTTTVTRPANTTAYTPNDAWSDSVSAPTSGGFVFTNAAGGSGKGGIINSAVITSTASPGTTLQGEIWIFDSTVTNINDNAAWGVSDADAVKLCGIVPFVLSNLGANNGQCVLSNLGLGFQCSGSANLYFLIKVLNGYTPVSSEALTVRVNITQGG